MTTVDKARSLVAHILHKQGLSCTPCTDAHLQAADEGSTSTGQAAEELRQVIQQAQDWQDLSCVLVQIQGGYERGDIDQQQAEKLATLAVERSRRIPEQRQPAGEVIWADDLLAPAPAAETCRCCGQAAWWKKASGQRMCGICHPDPRQITPIKTEGGGALACADA